MPIEFAFGVPIGNASRFARVAANGKFACAEAHRSECAGLLLDHEVENAPAGGIEQGHALAFGRRLADCSGRERHAVWIVPTREVRAPARPPCHQELSDGLRMEIRL